MSLGNESGASGVEPPGGGLAIVLAPDNMEVTAAWERPPADVEEAVRGLRAELVRLGIKDELSLTAAAQRFRAAIAAKSAEGRVRVLAGVPPIPPRDAQIVWAREFFKAGFHMDPETGAIDYRRRIADPTVKAGQRVATVTPPQAGMNGMDVFGHPIPSRAPRDIVLRAGKNVRLDVESRAYYAETDGRVRFVSGVVSVDGVFEIAGSVGLKTGHVRHPGALRVGKNIESGARVEAEGDIEVYGGIEDAVVECGGTLTVHGGVIGGEHCEIRVAGGMHARFVQNARMEIQGNLEVEHEIDQSHVRCLGRVHVASGRIVGGEVHAQGGIEVREAGSEYGVPTRLETGVDWALGERLAKLESEVEPLRQRLIKIRKQLAPLALKQDHLSAKARDIMRVLYTNADEMERTIAEYDQNMAALREESRSRIRDEVIVGKLIHPDVLLRVGGRPLRVKQPIFGPVRVVPGEDEPALEAAQPPR